MSGESFLWEAFAWVGVILGDPGRTRALFFRDPFVEDQSARLYRTADLARLTSSGSLECPGRIDLQVRIGGVRIELGETEEILRSHRSVSGAAVVSLGKSERSQASLDNTRSLNHDRATLVAYVTGSELDPSKLRAFVSHGFLRAMVPGEMLVLAELPITPNNKVDCRRLETMTRRKHEKSFQHPFSAMYAHSSLFHLVLEMQRRQLGGCVLCMLVPARA
jgi:acyl-coenzyme A synthetase/AMP-(fatty) acid ligase